MPVFSKHFDAITPSAIRMAQIEFAKRTDSCTAINTAIGNVSLPMHPAMTKRMLALGETASPFKDGVVRYTTTRGFEETNEAYMNILRASDCSTEGLYCQITTGGSQAMGLAILGVCGDAGTEDMPLLLIDAAYTNYASFARRLGRATVSVSRDLKDNGTFELPSLDVIEQKIKETKPNALVVIPYDNPTGHFYDHETMIKLAKLCVEHDMWIISDEAYRELHFTAQQTSSIWKITEAEVPGISGRRISIESASKVWNGCGLRIGALITDNERFSEQAVAENTAELCSGAIDQYVFGALAHESKADLNAWFETQRNYYRGIHEVLIDALKEELPGLIVSTPDASIYSVVDVRNLVSEFDASEFVKFCATQGKVQMADGEFTLLVAPMAGFYSIQSGDKNPGDFQMRIAYVESPENMKRIPHLFAELFKQYTQR